MAILCSCGEEALDDDYLCEWCRFREDLPEAVPTDTGMIHLPIRPYKVRIVEKHPYQGCLNIWDFEYDPQIGDSLLYHGMAHDALKGSVVITTVVAVERHLYTSPSWPQQSVTLALKDGSTFTTEEYIHKCKCGRIAITHWIHKDLTPYDFNEFRECAVCAGVKPFPWDTYDIEPLVNDSSKE